MQSKSDDVDLNVVLSDSVLDRNYPPLDPRAPRNPDWPGTTFAPHDAHADSLDKLTQFRIHNDSVAGHTISGDGETRQPSPGKRISSGERAEADGHS